MKKLFNKLASVLIVLLVISLIASISLSIYLSVKSGGKLTFLDKEPVKEEFLKDYAYISGEVVNPGVYEIQKSTKVIDLINLSGGFTDTADSNFVNEQINLAEIVKDQDHIHIPATNSTLGENSNEDNSDLVNLNTASKEQLESLPGVGSSTADKIINARPFSSIEDLLDVPGIGESKFSELKDYVTL